MLSFIDIFLIIGILRIYNIKIFDKGDYMKTLTVLLLLSSLPLFTGCKSDNSAAEARQTLRELNTPFSHPAFVQAVIDNDIDKVDLFLKGGMTDTNMQNSNPLRIAVTNNRMEVVSKLLEHGVEVDAVTFAGTPLCVAAAKNYTEIASILIKHGADVNYQKGDITPLIAASSLGNAEMVTMLLAAGADVNLQGDAEKLSPLMLAAANGHDNVVKLLLENPDIDPKLKDNGGNIALSYAIVRKEKGTASLLIEDKSFDPKNDGPVALTFAISRNELEIAKMIIDHGCDINAKYGELPILSWAIKNNYTDGAELLIQSGADIKNRDSANKIPIDYALSAKNEHIINMLRTAEEKLSEGEKEAVVTGDADGDF